ncbi:sensor histidine kinase [Saccharopolyspora taberi]|uniref:sensor histidine kinase n=1 Tax=Saccharopolyspora taberi TaxID=60895 RepID=UPI0031D0433D
MSDAAAVPDPAEFDSRRITRLRRYTWWVIVPTLPLFAVAATVQSIVAAAPGAYHGAHALVMLAILIVLGVEGFRFSLGMMRGLGQSEQHPAEQIAVFALSIAGLVYAVSLSPVNVLTWTLPPAGLAGILVAAAPRRFRAPLAVGLILLVCGAATGLMILLGKAIVLINILVYSGTVTAITTFAMLFQAWIWDVVLELDRARSVSGELAVAEERLRFAADLHDIQGHHLQAIALKGELAERLVGVDDAAARAQAAEIAELARKALKDTRDVVHGYRRTTLATELDNAVEILESAGIKTTVDGAVTAVAPPLEPLFGALVREGATNILRHSRAQHCELTISADDGQVRVVLRNDGVRPSTGAAGSGIDGLRDRFTTVGGQVLAAEHEGWFELVGLAGEPGRPRT